MFTKFLLFAVLVLPSVMVLSSGTATAAAETEATLRAQLITTTEFKRELKKAGSGVTFGDSEEVKSIQHQYVVSAGRRWWGTDDSLMYLVLMSFKDGHALSRAEREEVLSGQIVKDIVSGAFDSSEFLGDFGQVLDENDATHAFTAKMGRTNYDLMSVSFISGNMFGIILYSTPGTNNGTELGSAYGAQYVKLAK